MGNKYHTVLRSYYIALRLPVKQAEYANQSFPGWDLTFLYARSWTDVHFRPSDFLVPRFHRPKSPPTFQVLG